MAAARADFYPNIDLSAFAGTQAIGLDNLFHSAAGAFAVGPALHPPVFDAGRLRAKYRANTADIDIALAGYNQAVLSAVQETSDQLSNITTLDTSLVEEQKSISWKLSGSPTARLLLREEFPLCLSGNPPQGAATSCAKSNLSEATLCYIRPLSCRRALRPARRIA